MDSKLIDAPASFGEWLRHRRRELDLTQEALARQVGCARVTIRKLEADEIRPSRQLAELLAGHLQISPAQRENFVRLARGGVPILAGAPALPAGHPRHNLPRPPSSFIGRQHELAEVQRLLGQSRLVTLVGAGGIGKTRLAIEAARALWEAGACPDGVWWVELAPLTDPALVVKAVAKIAAVTEFANQPLADTLASHFQARQGLLVLDNCEHLILASAQLVDHLLGACPGLRVLVTSREALDIVGETIWPVPSLSLPGRELAAAAEALDQFESVRLFIDRVRLVQPAFTAVGQHLKVVAQICQRLSGMPLAIELAAARVKMMSVEEIARRLDDRFDLLTAGSRTALPRQQTLRATIDWSFDLLSEPERAFFRRLAVFAGGFDLAAAEAAVSDTPAAEGGQPATIQGQPVLALLGQLVNKSLIDAQPPAEGGSTRYRMLETVREYASQKLAAAGEAGALQDRHLDYFAQLAERAEPEIFSPKQMVWFRRFEEEIDNLRAAMQRSLASEAADGPGRAAWRQEAGLRLAAALIWFFERVYSHEACERLERMLGRPSDNLATRGRAKALMALGFLLWDLSRFPEARARLEAALPIFRLLNDPSGLAWTLDFLGWVTLGQHEAATAQAALEEAIATAETLGPAGQPALGAGLAFYGDVFVQQGQDDQALSYYRRALSVLAGAGDKNLRAHPARQIGYIALRRGNLDEAQAMFTASLTLNLEVGHQLGITAALMAFGKLAYSQQQYARAARLAGSVAGRLLELNTILLDADDAQYRRLLAGLGGALSADELDSLLAAGRGLSLEQALAEIWPG